MKIDELLTVMCTVRGASDARHGCRSCCRRGRHYSQTMGAFYFVILSAPSTSRLFIIYMKHRQLYLHEHFFIFGFYTYEWCWLCCSGHHHWWAYKPFWLPA